MVCYEEHVKEICQALNSLNIGLHHLGSVVRPITHMENRLV